MQPIQKLVIADVSAETVSACPEIERCPICRNVDFADDFEIKQMHIQYCTACQLRFLNPQPSNQNLASIYTANYFLNGESLESRQKVSQIKRATARIYLDMIAHYHDSGSTKLLEIGSGTGDFLIEAQSRGFTVTGIEYSEHAAETARMHLKGGTGQVICGEIENADLPPASFDVCVLSDVLEHSRDPERFLLAVHHFLKPGGIVFVAIPSLGSWSAKTMGRYWMEFKPEHLFYFNEDTLQNLLFVTNFNRVLLRPNVKVLTLGYVFAHFDRFEVPFLTPAMRLASKSLPQASLDKHRNLVASGLVAIARKQEAAPRRKLSIIMPVFNEGGTFQQVIEQLLRKEIADLDIEIIIVESNSNDGTREMTLQYKDHPRVTLVLEKKPKGKGHAVRAGLAHATGDFILIQDADLEYDMADYDALLEPLRQGKAAFVLGTRHDNNGLLKMRHFVDQPVMGGMLNFGHVFFSTLLNVLYRQRLNDPFTMYKVFRRDCLFGLKFQCNRFDFDFELVIKLLRKGYSPVEIPVSYRSRSFNEGKKVSLFRDPVSWFKALARFRIQRLNLVKNVHETNLDSKSDFYIDAHK